jgi:PAS domain S-box-containing protein
VASLFENQFLRAAGVAVLRDDDYFRKILEALPTAIYITDSSGRIVYYNQAAVDFAGRAPVLGSDEWCVTWKLYWPDGTPLPHDQCPMAIALKEGRPVRNAEAVAERPDGTRVPFIPYPTPLYDDDGTLIGAVNMLMDVSERQQREQADRRLASIVESCDDAIVSKDLQGIIRSWNGGAQRLFGYSADEVVGRSITILIPPDRQDEEPKILERLRRGERVEHYETVRRRKDGSLVDISLTVSPVLNAKGEVVGASKVARDITELKRARDMQKLFVAEIKHRIKNTLATVQAMANQTMKSAPREDREAFGARLAALASAHDLLTIENWNRAPLREIADRALQPFRQQYRERFHIEGSTDAWLDASKAALITMALHELATNAAKYGALSNDSGRVSVVWGFVPDCGKKLINFAWIESGGPPVVKPTRRGFGSLLIERAMKAEARGIHLDFDEPGVTCMFELEAAN